MSPGEIESGHSGSADGAARRNGPASAEPLPAKVRRDLDEDELDPSRIVPSAEGSVRFAGLSRELRNWLNDQLEDLRGRTNGRGDSKPDTNGGDAAHDHERGPG